MPRFPLGVAARVVAVVGIVGATMLQGVAAHAADSISFINCTGTTPTPTPTASGGPTATPGSTASPAATPTPAPTQTPDNCVPNSGAVITDVHTLKFSVHTDTFQSHIDSVTASIAGSSQGVPQPDQSAIHVQCPGGNCQSNNSNRKDETDQVIWDTNELTPYNGVYTFKVKAHFTRPTGSGVMKTADDQCVRGCNLVVDNVPQQPNAPRIVVTTATSVSLAWDANPEPDVLSYTVYRAITKNKSTPPTDAMFKLDFVTVGTSVRETVKDPGAYWYRVQATRRSFSAEHKDTGISSALSSSSAAGVVSAPAATAKTTTKNGSHVVALPPPASAILTPPGLIPTVAAAPPPVPDAPYSAFLPYKSSGTSEDAGPPAPEAGANGVDPRGAILPVAVGAFLVSSALALGRMPF